MLKKQFSWAMGASLLVLMLAACQPQSEKQQSQEQATAASEIQSKPIRLEGELQKLNLNLPSCDGNNCSVLQVERLQSNMPFVDQWVDQQISALLNEMLSDAPQQVTAASDVTVAASEITDISDKLKLEQKLALYKNAFIALDDELKALSAGHPINIMIKPKILNAEQPLATVVLNSSSYLGGAHGASSQNYYNFDLNSKKRVVLNDILQPKQSAALKAKSYEAFKAWVIASQLATDVAEYEQAWQFNMTDNFYLGKQGLILQYAEYEIGPYVVGLPRLVIPYTDLAGILKPQYLPATEPVTDQVKHANTQHAP